MFGGGIEMMIDSFLEGHGTSTKEIGEMIEKGKTQIPAIVSGLQDRVQNIEATQTRIETKVDAIIKALVSAGVISDPPNIGLAISTQEITPNGG